MALPTPTDISTGIATRWAAFGALAAEIPVDHLYLGRTASRTAFPRARLMIEEGDSETTSGTLVLMKFSVTIEAYVLDEDATTVGGMLKTLMNWNNMMAADIGWTLPNGSMISVKPIPGGTTKQTGEQRQSDVDGELKDTVIISSRWEALVEGRRSMTPIT